MIARLLPDTEELARFASVIFKRANPNGIVSLRAFPDASKNTKPLFFDPISIGDPQFREVVYERAQQAANWHTPMVFCPPVVTFLSTNNAKAENVLEGVTLSVDCDRAPNAALAMLKKILGDPTVIVESGGEWKTQTPVKSKRRFISIGGSRLRPPCQQSMNACAKPATWQRS